MTIQYIPKEFVKEEWEKSGAVGAVLGLLVGFIIFTFLIVCVIMV